MGQGHGSDLLRRVLSLLMLRHPMRTSCGVGFGLLLGTVLDVANAHGWVSTAPFVHPEWVCAVLGGVLVHVPFAFRGSDLPEDVEIKFRVARRVVEEGRLTEVQRRMVYVRVLDEVLAEHSAARTEQRQRVVRQSLARDPEGTLPAPEDGGS